MLQHIKADIIYYDTQTDFEMEFNLCGCCRIRLLTDKAPDKKTLGACLSRAVSRSKIILIVGNLFGDSGTISLVSNAIGTPLSLIDNKEYHLSSSDEINIPNGSVPLITPDGLFGGCLIVSGPQTMILLSESKNIRKSIMTNLVHPYIKDLSVGKQDEQNNDVSQQSETEQPIIENEIIEEDDDLIIEENTSAENIVEENEIPQEDNNLKPDENAHLDNDISLEDDIILSGSMEYEQDKSVITPNVIEQEPEIDLFIESKKVAGHNINKTNATYANYDGIDDDLVFDDDINYNKGFLKINILMTVIAVLLLIAIAVLCYSVFYVPSAEGIQTGEYIKDIFTTLFG